MPIQVRACAPRLHLLVLSEPSPRYCRIFAAKMKAISHTISRHKLLVYLSSIDSCAASVTSSYSWRSYDHLNGTSLDSAAERRKLDRQGFGLRFSLMQHADGDFSKATNTCAPSRPLESPVVCFEISVQELTKVCLREHEAHVQHLLPVDTDSNR